PLAAVEWTSESAGHSSAVICSGALWMLLMMISSITILLVYNTSTATTAHSTSVDGIMTTGAALVNHHLTPARTALFGVSNALRVGVYADFEPFDYEAVNQMLTPWFSQWQNELYLVELAFNGESSSLRIQNRSLLYTEKCMVIDSL
ncbi:hypothetical protein FOZ63_033931, partial [Perkinsus olseni]